MKDLMQIANEANEQGKNEREVTELFATKLLDELKKMKGTDISPYLSCEFDIIRKQYVVTLKLPVTANIFNTIGSDSK